MNEPIVVPITRGALRLRSGALIGARTDHSGGQTRVLAFRSTDGGTHWSDLGAIVTDPDPKTDLGDGAFCETRSLGLLYICRHNHHATKSYAIRVHQSRDQGKTWRLHSTVTEHTITTTSDPSRGLWAPFLIETPEHRLLAVYDDENYPLLAGFRGHQWLMGRFWETDRWSEPVVVSRAHNPQHLSRDGMATIIAVGKRQLLCAFESVGVAPPHPNVVRWVRSDDGGKTWSWQQAERGVLYTPAKPNFMALAPFLTRTDNGTLWCVFVTDEDQATPDRSGTPPRQMHLSVKVVTSTDNGMSWSPAQTLYTGAFRNYLPGLIALPQSRVLAHWLDYARDALLAAPIDFPRKPASPG